MARVFIVTGEASGDAVGAGVARYLTLLRPGVEIEGIGAARMTDAGVRLYASSRSWASIGIVQSIPQAPKVLLLLRRLKKHLKERPPDVLVLVDFGAFNTRLGAWAVENGIRTVYLMPPGSWRKDPSPARLAALARTAHLFLSPFAWNAENLRKAGANAAHIGHPVLELAQPTPHAAELSQQLRPSAGRLIALLPGSRRHEVDTLAPQLITVAYEWPYPEDRFALVQAPSFTDAEFTRAVRERLPAGWKEEARQHNLAVQGFLAGRRASELDEQETAELNDLLRANSPRFSVIDGGTADPFWVSDLAIVCAGTATLEGVVAGKPMVVVYDGPWLMHLEWRMRRKRVNAPWVAMPNIIAGREIVPELLGEDATIENIVGAARAFVDDPAKAAVTVRMLEKVRSELKPEGALSTAAASIIQAGGLS